MTVAEIYAYLTMGLGYDPKYVLDEMKQYEIDAAMKYSHYKKRDLWDVGRLISYVVAKGNGSKANGLDDFLPLPWEKEEKEPQREMTREDIDAMKKIADSYIKR